MEVIWTEEAVNDYHQNIEYLLAEWSETVAIDFIEDVDATLELIKLLPEMFPLSDYQSVRKEVILKQISLFYRVDGEKIFLLRFWNNYKNPDALKL
ncbi:MAG: type II toxin-antitoxin system RelE/ParE family toxin [Chitinophagales bacterium]|nr:type II toxin-antitoxin system RelE/ParE family toxin [Chitinophagales bacterium]